MSRPGLALPPGPLPANLAGGFANVRPTLAGPAALSAYWAEVLADDPVLFVPCDDLDGSATARAIVGADGSYVGAPNLRVAGPSPAIPYVFSTDGTAEYVDVSTPTTAIDAAQTWEFVGNYPLVINSGTAFVRPLADDAADGSACKLDLGSLTGTVSGEVVMITNGEGGTNYFTYWTGFSIPAGWHHWMLTFTGTRGQWELYLDGANATSGTWGATKSQHNGGSRGMRTTSQTLGGFTGNGQYRAWNGLGALVKYDAVLSAGRALAHAEAAGLAA